MTSHEDLGNRFLYHPPNEATRETHNQIRGDILAFAMSLDSRIPEGREKALFLTNLEQASFWAHAAIARQGEPA